jgi:hypothetical protein
LCAWWKSFQNGFVKRKRSFCQPGFAARVFAEFAGFFFEVHRHRDAFHKSPEFWRAWDQRGDVFETVHRKLRFSVLDEIRKKFRDA